MERVLVDNDDNFVTCMTVQPDRQLLALGFNDGKIALYDVRSNSVVHQKQQHSRFVQDIHCTGDHLYSIGNDNILTQSHLSSFNQYAQTYELPYGAVGPFPTTLPSPTGDNQVTSPSVPRTSTPVMNSNNNFFPMGNVFDFDPFDADRLITCSASHARFYRLSTSDEDTKIQLPTTSYSPSQPVETTSASSCVHWQKDRDTCMIANTNGMIQLYRRVNRADV